MSVDRAWHHAFDSGNADIAQLVRNSSRWALGWRYAITANSTVASAAAGLPVRAVTLQAGGDVLGLDAVEVQVHLPGRLDRLTRL